MTPSINSRLIKPTFQINVSICKFNEHLEYSMLKKEISPHMDTTFPSALCMSVNGNSIVSCYIKDNKFSDSSLSSNAHLFQQQPICLSFQQVVNISTFF